MNRYSLGAGLTAATLLIVVSTSSLAGSDPDTLDPGTYNAVNRGVSAATHADAQSDLGVSAYGSGSLDGNAGMHYTATSKMTFDCRHSGQVRHGRAGMAWKSIGQCDDQHITLAHCNNQMADARACQSGDYTGETTIQSGQTVTRNDTRITVACQDTHCTVTTKRRGGAHYDAGHLRGPGRQALAASRAESGIQATITDTATDEDYLAYRRTTGAHMSGCSQRIQDQARATDTVIDCSGTHRADLTFNGIDCGKRCIGRSEQHYQSQESCQSSVPVSKQICTTTYGSRQCITQPMRSTRTETQPLHYDVKTCDIRESARLIAKQCNVDFPFNISTGECSLIGRPVPKACRHYLGRRLYKDVPGIIIEPDDAWVYFYACVDGDSQPTSSCSASSLDGYSLLNTYGSGFDAVLPTTPPFDPDDGRVSKHYKKSYVRIDGFGERPADEQPCEVQNARCTDTQPRTGPAGTRLPASCYERKLTLSCPGGGQASTCQADDPPDAGCADTEQQCDNVRQFDAKTCHYAHERNRPTYQCPTGSQLDWTTLNCYVGRSCPKGMHYPGLGDECVSNTNGLCIGDQCYSPVQCPSGFSFNRTTGRCETPSTHISDDSLPTVVKSRCPSQYFESDKSSQCQLDDAACQKPGDIAPGKPAVRITSARVVRHDGGVSGLDLHWNSAGDAFKVHYRGEQDEDVCNPDAGWRAIITFDLPVDIDQIASFYATQLRYNDNMVVTLNGQKIFASNLDCTSADGHVETVHENLAPLVKKHGNVLKLKAYGGPSHVALGGVFKVGRKCFVEPDQQVVADRTGCQIPYDPTHPYTTTFDCGPKAGLTSSCEKGSLAGWQFEGRSNETTDSQGNTLSYDEVYTHNEHVDHKACSASASPFCHKTATTCVDVGPRIVDGVKIKRKCFHTVATYRCDNGGHVAQCTNNALPGDCKLSTTQCLRTDSDSGRCLAKKENYVCTQTGVTHQCSDDLNTERGCGQPVEVCSKKDSNGNCLQRQTITKCYAGQPNRCMHDAACTLDGTSCSATDQDSGLCKRQTQNYSCDRTHVTCNKTAEVCGQKPPGTPFGKEFNKVAAAEAKSNALIQEAKRGGNDLDDLRIMTGKAVSCTDDLIGEPIAAKCCSDKADESGLFDACNQEEKDLAAAKRADRTHKIGRYCSRKINVGVAKVCIAKRSTYCQFNSLFARLVQEQGRPQLNQIAQSPAGSTTRTDLTFPYMADQSGWSHTVDVQGRTVAGYTWDTACTDGNAHAQNQYVGCPVDDEFFIAVCDANQCPTGDIPEPYKAGQNSADWKLIRMNAEHGSRAVTLTKNANAGGRCSHDDNAPGGFSGCRVTITSWPRGSGGGAELSIDISWPLYRGDGTQNGWTTPVRQSGRFRIQPYQIKRNDGTAMPDKIPLRVAVDDGSFHTYTIPTTIPTGGMKLSTTPESRVFGACHPDRNWCRMKILTRVKIHGKHWCNGGDCPRKGGIDCSGFTIEQFMALDFSSMNLSEFTQSVSPKVPQRDILQGITGSDATQIEQDYHSSVARKSPGSGTDQVFEISPVDGRAPWQTTARIAKQMRTDKGLIDVRSVRIDWGDGDHQTVHPRRAAGAFKVDHTYTDKTDRTYRVIATYHLANGHTQRTRAKLRSWTHEPPRDITPYGGGQSGSTTHQTDATPSGQSGRTAPPGHYDLSGGQP